MNHDNERDLGPLQSNNGDREFVRPPDEGKPYQKIDESLGRGEGYGEQVAKEHAEEALEELFASEFPIDDPPESFERYEAELTVRHMRQAVRGMFEVNDHVTPVEVVVEMPADKNSDEWSIEEWGDGDPLKFVGHATSMIDVMATYGGLAEPHIAALAYADLPPDVREHAIETLAELRGDDTDDEPLSLREAIGRWLLPGGE